MSFIIPNTGKTCGTMGTAWMDASLPALGDPPKDVTMKIAFNGNADFSKDLSRAAKVVACKDTRGQIYYLYHLIPMEICHFLYCATTQV